MENGEWSPFALAAKVYDDLNPSWEMTMHGPFRAGYIETQKIKIETLQKMEVWYICWPTTLDERAPINDGVL